MDDTTLTDLITVESMNQFFPSVFTSEDFDNFPKLDYVCESKLSYIQRSINEVEKLLKFGLNVYKLNPLGQTIYHREF